MSVRPQANAVQNKIYHPCLVQAYCSRIATGMVSAGAGQVRIGTAPLAAESALLGGRHQANALLQLKRSML